jgi:hypothetical protein
MKGSRVVRPCLGKVAANCQADLTLIAKKTRLNPYSTLVQSNQEDVSLVVVAGTPLYGEVAYMESFAKSNLQKLPLSVSGSCRVFRDRRKAIRLAKGEYEKVTSEDLTRVRAIKKELASKLGEDVLDPLFNCEDEDYQEDFDNFEIR